MTMKYEGTKTLLQIRSNFSLENNLEFPMTYLFYKNTYNENHALNRKKSMLKGISEV